jgi:glycosyltransferase involved in cell wall biosynthesis
MDKQLPLVSIVFTSYNHKEYLKQALDSLLYQTYQNIEIIIIDDCSTDGSQEILKQYVQNEKINLHLKEHNSGSYVNASNYGATFAKGEYLIFAQCDDYAEPDQIKLLSNVLNEHPEVGVVFSKSLLVDENGKFLSDDFVIREKKFKDVVANESIISGNVFRELLTVSCVIPNLSAAMIRREMYDKINGLSNKYYMASDWCFWLELSEITNFLYLSQPLNNFRQHSTTIRSKTKIVNHLKEIFNERAYLMIINYLWILYAFWNTWILRILRFTTIGTASKSG